MPIVWTNFGYASAILEDDLQRILRLSIRHSPPIGSSSFDPFWAVMCSLQNEAGPGDTRVLATFVALVFSLCGSRMAWGNYTYAGVAAFRSLSATPLGPPPIHTMAHAPVAASATRGTSAREKLPVTSLMKPIT